MGQVIGFILVSVLMVIAAPFLLALAMWFWKPIAVVLLVAAMIGLLAWFEDAVRDACDRNNEENEARRRHAAKKR